LLAQTNAEKIIGLDISAGMLEVGEENCGKELSNTRNDFGRFENMPLKNSLTR
jgi:demethylmenaquinone methyltransferase/2-methoxy-6-polyprenyl-1,4-benzoquinol methylase